MQILPIRLASCLDAVEKLLSIPESFERVILATNYPDLAREAAKLGAEVIMTPTEGFHLGEHLRDLVLSQNLERVFYMTGAGAPLLSIAELQEASNILQSRDEVVYVNNVQSIDFVGWTPANRIALIKELPVFDNSLGYLLQREGNLPRKLIPHSIGAHYDLDTPIDIQILKFLRHSATCTPRLQQAIDNLDWPAEALAKFWENFVVNNNYPSLWISGRIGGPTIEFCDRVGCGRLRIVSEERGMRSTGRQNMVNSLVGQYIEGTGIDGFFKYVESAAEAALIDTRPLFVHFKLDPDENDRFYSDLGEWQRIKDPWVREFTKRAREASIPIILGGHTLVLGGIWAIAEEIAAYRRIRETRST